MSNFDNQFWELQRKRAKKLEEEEEAKKTTSLKDDDIAPVAKTTTTTKADDDKRDDGWLKKGAFEDGYQFGDVLKTIDGTVTSLRENLSAGILGMGEAAVDTGAYIAGGVGGFFGADDFQDDMATFIKKDLYDEKAIAKKIIGAERSLTVQNQLGWDTEENSVLGEKSEGLAQSAGELIGVAALQYAQIPWFLTTGVISFGRSVESALNEGASYGDAGGSALISAGAEILTEKLSGGIKFGGKTLDDVLLQPLTQKISNKVLRTLTNVGLDAVGEGFEEVASSAISRLGTALYKEESIDELLTSEEAMDEYIESFIGGSVLGGGMGSVRAVNSIATGRDYKTGLTDNEQKVIDQEVANRVAEAEEDGKKLTTKEKNKIYDEVIDDLRKGYISTDAIESIFGGEDYKAYQSILEKEQPLRDEINSIESNDSLTDEQKQTLIKSVEDKLNALATETNKAQVRQKLDDVMKSQLVRKVGKNTQTDRFLLESYNESERRRQKFEADLTKYDAKQAEVIKKAVDSGILNNTNRTHEFVDMVAKISADKGVLFDFANNAKLKESGFTMNGKRVNGYVTKDGITVNIDSHKSLNSVVGHEIAHVLEGTELYTEMQNALFEYAKSKNDYDGRYKDLEALYKGVEGASVDAELTADLVGDYLFTDSDFINSLSTKNRNVFQKIYDEIKYLCKIATAGSKEARELERVKRAFDKAYREAGKAQSDTKYSLSEDAKKADADYLDAVDRGDTETAQKMLDAVASEAGYKKLFYHGTPNGDFTKFNTHGKPIWIAENQAYAEVYASEKSGYKEDERVMPLYAKMDNTLDLTQVDTSKLLFEPVPRKYPRNDIDFPSEELKKLANIVGVDTSVFSRMCKNTPYESIWELINTKQFANLVKEKGYDSIKEDEFGNITYGVFNSSQLKSADAITYDWKKKAIPLSKRFDTENKDIRYSLSADTQGRELTANQRDYFKDSKIVDENGNLKVMYHGTPNGEFTVFKDGTYFTENKWYADLYQNPGASSISTGKVASNPKTFEVYLNIKKPFDINDAEARSIYINDYIKGGNAVGINPYLSDAEYNKINAIDWTEGEDLRDFLIDNGYDYDGLVLDEGAVGGYGDDVKYRGKSYVIFNPEQVKNVDNVNPTSDPDIRFSLSKPVEETKDLMAIHNLKSEELLKSLDLGGLPMPSLAIIKAEAGHEQYGDISLIFPKETIDPKANKGNKVYGGDAWTPTYPRMEYKANESVAKRISDKYRTLEREYGYEKARPLYDYVYELENALNRSGGETSLKEELYDDTRMMQVYLLDSGKGEVPMVQKEIRTELTDHEVSMYEFFAQKLGNEVINGVNQAGLGSPFEQRKAYWENHGEAIKEAYSEFLSKEFGFSEEDIQNVISNMKTADFLKVVRDAKRYQTNGRVTIKTEDDYMATQEAIRKAAGEGYKAWVDDLFSGSEEKSGIRNNVDYYTRSGNRRSWDALHWENTLENVVKAMKQQDSTGSEAVFGVHKFFAASSKDYRNVDEIKADSDRLHKISDGDYKAAKDAFESRFVDIANRIMDKTESNSFIAQDNAMECIVDAVRQSKTKAGIYKELSQYKQLNVTEQDVADILSLVDDISNMPTGYFEAKPRRAVGFDEVGVFVIPNNTDVKLKQELLNRGYSIAEYDPNVEGDRQRVVNQFEEYKFSLSNVGEQPKHYGNYNVYGKDIALETEEAAPTKDIPDPRMVALVQETEDEIGELPYDSLPMADEPNSHILRQEYEELATQAEEALDADDTDTLSKLMPRIGELEQKIKQAEATEAERFASLDDADAPPEMEAPYSEDNIIDPFEDRDIAAVGNRKVKAYMYENPEVKPFFQQEAEIMLGEWQNTDRGERWYNGDQLYDLPYDVAWDKPKFGGRKRNTTPDIAKLLDDGKGNGTGYTYEEIRKGLEAIIKDDGAENNACSKRIEFILNERLMNGYETTGGYWIKANQAYRNLIKGKGIAEYNEEAFNRFMEMADEYAPPEDIAPVEEIKADPKAQKAITEDIAPTPTYETKKQSEVKGQQTMFPEGKVAEVLSEEPKIDQNKRSAWSMFKNNVLDKGMVFEDLSLETGNRELQARWNSIRYAEGKAQKLIGEGNASVSSLKSIQETVENSGKTKQFYEYLYHKHNVDRMSLEEKAKPTILALQGKFENLEESQIKAIAAKKITDKTTEKTANTIREAREYLRAMETKNKPVFGDSITAEVSRDAAAKLEKANPEFKEYAREVYDYMNYLREMLVDAGVISSDTAKLWAEMYPNYVPIRRAGDTGLNDTGRPGVNAPIKRATGGNRDILPLFDTMAMRTEQTFKAIAKNRFGVELKNTLGTTIADETTSVDDAIDSIDTQDGLLQEGKNGKSPTFTVFENGNKVTFEITEEMYDAMKPTGKGLSYTNKVANTVGNVFRGLLTEYNPVFMATNVVKDAQDVLINSQHAAKTYATIPKAIAQMAGNGHWYQEYLANGGEQNTYFDSKTNTFKAEDEGIKKLIGMPLRGISYLNNAIERIPRLAEYIASREAGRSIDVSMLDAARVTTNFAAGGDVTKFFNRNGFNFLNASMQGAMQQARNVREAKANGLKGWMQLATKVALAGLPAILLNNLLWDDDEEYEELSDYVKQNYYVVAKFGDGKFVRIPKGRTLAVIQNAFEQMGNLITGDDEADLASFLELAISNLAPNNPLENNILAPIMQAKNNETWYGEDLVPTRLQDLPAAEQYDESTDAISKWLGEKLNVSPYKLNYLLNQYSGGLGDVFLPMMTPEAESGDNSLAGNLIAPWKDKFTTDSVMNNQYVSDFYDTVDELTANAKSSKATDEDVLKYKYMNSVNAELGELYAQKREIQNSDLADDEKYAAVREIQEQIDSLAKESLGTYGDVYINDGYATVGDRHYKLNDEGEWQKLSNDQLEKQEEVTSGLGIDPSDYWSNKSEYDFAYEYPEKYAVAKSIGGYDAYKTYSSELYDIKADKDEDGKSINGSRKEKVIDYINNLDADYGEKIILFKSEYNADDTYNYDIIEYLNSREDISYEEMETILKELGFTVKADGTVEW